jgi:hypothetical protein
MPGSVSRRWTLALVAACVGATLLVTVDAQSAQPAPPGASAVDQYRELVPGAAGEQGSGIGTDGSSLPPDAAAALDSASPDVAAALERIATSSKYGAPVGTETGGAGDGGASDPSAGSTIGSTIGAIGSTSDARVLALLVVLIATTFAGIVLVLRRRPGAPA